MNCESCDVPKNELITDDSVLALIRSTGVNTSLSRTFMRRNTVKCKVENFGHYSKYN